MPEQRRFRRPWKVVENEESFEIQDANDFPLCFLYFADDFKRNWAFNRGRLTKDEAWRIANAIARLPDLLTIEKAAKSPVPDIPDED